MKTKASIKETVRYNFPETCFAIEDLIQALDLEPVTDLF